MANNNSQDVHAIKVKASGVCLIAPKGTELPVGAKAALNEAFANAGYISEDGVTNSVETDSNDIKALGGDVVLTVKTSRKETFKMVFIETNEQTLKQFYGAANVQKGEDSFTVKHNGLDDTEFAYVLEVALTGGYVERTVVPRGKVIETGERTWKDGEAIGYDVTINALPDADGNTAYTYIAKVEA